MARKRIHPGGLVLAICLLTDSLQGATGQYPLIAPTLTVQSATKFQEQAVVSALNNFLHEILQGQPGMYKQRLAWAAEGVWGEGPGERRGLWEVEGLDRHNTPMQSDNLNDSAGREALKDRTLLKLIHGMLSAMIPEAEEAMRRSENRYQHFLHADNQDVVSGPSLGPAHTPGVKQQLSFFDSGADVIRPENNRNDDVLSPLDRARNKKASERKRWELLRSLSHFAETASTTDIFYKSLRTELKKGDTQAGTNLLRDPRIKLIIAMTRTPEVVDDVSESARWLELGAIQNVRSRLDHYGPLGILGQAFVDVRIQDMAERPYEFETLLRFMQRTLDLSAPLNLSSIQTLINLVHQHRKKETLYLYHTLVLLRDRLYRPAGILVLAYDLLPLKVFQEIASTWPELNDALTRLEANVSKETDEAFAQAGARKQFIEDLITTYALPESDMTDLLRKVQPMSPKKRKPKLEGALTGFPSRPAPSVPRPAAQPIESIPTAKNMEPVLAQQSKEDLEAFIGSDFFSLIPSLSDVRQWPMEAVLGKIGHMIRNLGRRMRHEGFWLQKVLGFVSEYYKDALKIYAEIDGDYVIKIHLVIPHLTSPVVLIPTTARSWVAQQGTDAEVRGEEVTMKALMAHLGNGIHILQNHARGGTAAAFVVFVLTDKTIPIPNIGSFAEPLFWVLTSIAGLVSLRMLLRSNKHALAISSAA